MIANTATGSTTSAVVLGARVLDTSSGRTGRVTVVSQCGLLLEPPASSSVTWGPLARLIEDVRSLCEPCVPVAGAT